MKRKIFILTIILFIFGIQYKTFAYSVTDSSFVQLYLKDNTPLNKDVYLNGLLDKCRFQYTSKSPQYAECMLWCAHLCVEEGDNIQGKQLLDKSKFLFKKYGQGSFDGRDTLAYIFSLDLMAKIEYGSGRDFYSLKLLKKSCDLKGEYFGEGSEPYLNALLDLSQLYAERLKHRKSNLYHNIGYRAYVERIRNEFCETSESKRSLYWDDASKYIHRTITLAHDAGSKISNNGDNSLASAAYNALLLSKGLLLNTTLGFEEYIENSNNVKAISLLHTKKAYANQQLPVHILDSLDYEIIDALKQNGQQFELPHLSINWKNVASKLSKHDLAIEFYKTKEGKYGAILLKSTWKSPKIVRLKDYVKINGNYIPMEKALKEISLEHYQPENLTALWALSKTIWSDEIVKYFPTGNDGCVYFSTDGELLITGIEYFPFLKPDRDGTFYCMSDLFTMYRLSSTRQLAVGDNVYNNDTAAIYGGLRYDMQYKEMIGNIKTNTINISQNENRSLRAVDGIKYLSGTKREAVNIIKIINDSSMLKLRPMPYLGKDGTETSLKKLGSKHQRLIHIATHGYFYNEEDEKIKLFGLGNHPLNRSGLLFAGADNKWFGEEFPEGVDDGFLTALEISNIDFSGLELVVLSACETGKGDISGDGVFGLQRGFKMAGANSILMSLWKVDDDATCLLMTEFYKNWIKRGKKKHEALNLAKQTVRSHKEKGWDNPNYWAAFILLDGLD